MAAAPGQAFGTHGRRPSAAATHRRLRQTSAPAARRDCKRAVRELIWAREPGPGVSATMAAMMAALAALLLGWLFFAILKI